MEYNLDFISNSNLSWLRDNTIFLTVVGSQSYGLATPESDYDFKGIAIPPKNYFHGFLDKFEQSEFRKPGPDCCIFNIVKWVYLACDNNPSVIEILWTDPKHYVITTPYWEKFIENRDSFLSKNVRWRFSGYGISQLRKMKKHYRWLNCPLKEPPKRADFGLPEYFVLPKDQMQAAFAMIDKRLDGWNPDFGVDDNHRIEIMNKVTDVMTEICGASLYLEKDKLWKAAAVNIGMDTNFIELIQKEKEYKAKKAEWDSYCEWKLHRNTKRAELEAKTGYDCYSDDTEFLTDSGWKLFDEVCENDKLATVFIKRGYYKDEKMLHKNFLGIEYQAPLNMFDAKYNGIMYNILGQHTDVLVTSNHRMLFRKIFKDKSRTDWILDEAALLPSEFDILIAPKPRKKNFRLLDDIKRLSISELNYLKLMGWYLSDGCIGFRYKNNKKPRVIRLSQKIDGKLSNLFRYWYNNNKDKINTHIYNYNRKPNDLNPNSIIERVLIVDDKKLVNKIIDDCGYKENKRIPRWAFNMSKRLMEILLYALLGGDGTKVEHVSKNDSYIYYSKSKKLADDVQELAMMCGWETALWGPYKNTNILGNEFYMYQVHLREGAGIYRQMGTRNIKKIEVNDQRIVCFTVPNGTLITRRNGKIGIHGNCKDGAALIRIMRMGKEILSTGNVIVERLDDREELLDIKRGKWPYEKVIEEGEKLEKEMEVLYSTTKLPNEPNRKLANKLCIEIVEEFLSKT